MRTWIGRTRNWKNVLISGRTIRRETEIVEKETTARACSVVVAQTGKTRTRRDRLVVGSRATAAVILPLLHNNCMWNDRHLR